jgi:hypothetical protein
VIRWPPVGSAQHSTLVGLLVVLLAQQLGGDAARVPCERLTAEVPADRVSDRASDRASDQRRCPRVRASAHAHRLVGHRVQRRGLRLTVELPQESAQQVRLDERLIGFACQSRILDQGARDHFKTLMVPSQCSEILSSWIQSSSISPVISVTSVAWSQVEAWSARRRRWAPSRSGLMHTPAG